MTSHDDERDELSDRAHDETRDETRDGAHFDEIDAQRRFPSEDTWLDLPMPADEEPADGEPADAEPANEEPSLAPAGVDDTPESTAAPWLSGSAFADRVLRARREEEQLDRELAELERDLPADLLHRHAAPEPSAGFVDLTLAAIRQERQQRWQAMLARYVAPEPSSEFVSRTLAALAKSGDGDARRPAATRGARSARGARGGDHERAGRAPRRQWPVLLVAGIAAAALLWLALSPVPRQPLEIRLAQQASPVAAYADSSTPLAAVLGRIHHDEEPFAIFDEPVDGLWLASASGELR